jgi:subtilisin family serine protease
MNRRAPWLIRLIVLSLLLATFAGPLPATPGIPTVARAEAAYSAKIDPQVWSLMGSAPDGATDAIIMMSAQADLSFAERIDDWNARGWAVYSALRETADGSQTRVLSTLAREQALGHATRYTGYWIANMVTVHGNRDALLAVAALPEVDHVLPPVRLEQDQPLPGIAARVPLTAEWGIAKIRADAVWAAYNVTGTGSVVANVDTGVEYTHTALINQYRGNLGGNIFDHNYNWWDVHGSTAPYDDNDHGTHTMGTMVGDDGAGNQIGVAPGAKWIAARGCCPDNDALFTSLQWMVAPTRLDGTQPDPSKRPDVVNNSWGGAAGGAGTASTMYDLFNAAQRAAGIVPVFSAGNSGPGCATIHTPGDNPTVLSVAATASTDIIAGFSSRGPSALITGASPQVSAPGVNVRSSVPPFTNTYASFSGTSMAAPHVSGAVALLISAEPKLRGQVAQIEELFRKTADPKTLASQTCGGIPGTQVPNNTFGWGRINVKAAVDMTWHAGWLSGTVTAGGVPVTGTLVTFANTAYTYTLTTKTDGLGQYRVVAGAGAWNMTAGAYGYQTATANGLTVTQNNVTTQNFTLSALPTYTVSGAVTDSAGGAGVAAYLEIANQDLARPTWASSAGAYSLIVPQGAYSLTVSHPGYTPQTLGINVNGNTTLNVQLVARANYTCLDSRDPGGPTYNWIEASDGTPHAIGDNGNVAITLPGAFTYFGSNFTIVQMGSNGLIQFAGTPSSEPTMYVPYEGYPNNDVMGLSEDLNPNNGSQGMLYHKVIGTKIVLQYQAVEHWLNGDPETFEFVLDTADNSILVQYKDLSWPDFTGGGLENNTGTVGQLWSHMNSAHLINGLAVLYTPATGNAVNWGCDHALWMTHGPNTPVVNIPQASPEVTFRTAAFVTGPFGAPGVVLTATVPAGSTLIETSPGGVVTGRTITWNVGNARIKSTGGAWFRVAPYNWLPDGFPLISYARISDASGQWRLNRAVSTIVRTGGAGPNQMFVPYEGYNAGP